MKANLIRTESGDHGTFGLLSFAGSPKVLFTAEPPWRNNTIDRSCIPCGSYLCEWARSPSRGWLYYLRDVPGRTDVQFHVGNYAGDEEKGLRADTDACILPGLTLGELNKQRVVTSSRDALNYMHAYLQKRSFWLEVMGVVGHDF